MSDFGSGNGYVWIGSGGITYISCYILLNVAINEFRQQLNKLEDIARIRMETSEIVLAGDLNSKALAWGETRTDPRGRLVLEMLARLDLTVLNIGNTTTFRREGTRGSIVDVTFASAGLAPNITAWKVLEDYSASDHQFIEYEIKCHRSVEAAQRIHPIGWNAAKPNRDNLRKALISAPPLLYENVNGRSVDVEELAGQLMSLMKNWCDKCMPRRAKMAGRSPSYW